MRKILYTFLLLFSLSSFSQTADAFLRKGIEAGNKKQYKVAISYFNEALKIDPKNAQALYYKGLSLQNMGAFSGAIKFYTFSLEYLERGETYHNRAYCLSKIFQDSLAIIDLSKAIEMDGENIKYLKTRINIYRKTNQYDLMLKDIDTYLDRAPNNFSMKANKAVVLTLLNKPKEAIVIYRELLKQKPKEKKLYYGVSRLYLSLEKFDVAISNINKAIALDSQYVKAYLLKSKILKDSGEKEAACITLDKAAKLGADIQDETYQEILKYCKN